MARYTRKTAVSTLNNAADQTASRLMALAPELRNRIYELVFEGETVAIQSKGKYNPEGRSTVPGILLACKHIYVETLQIFFSKCLFLFTSQQKLSAWIHNIGEQNRSCVAHIDFRVYSSAVKLWGQVPDPTRAMVLLKTRVLEAELRRYGVDPGRCRIRMRIVSPIADDYQVWWKEVGQDGVEMVVMGEYCRVWNHRVRA